MTPSHSSTDRVAHRHPDVIDEVDGVPSTHTPHTAEHDRNVTTDTSSAATRWGTAIDQGNHRRSIRELSRRLGFGDLTPYELRHTAITHQIEAGHPASVVADWAGTSERMIYQHYRHQLREVVDLRPPDLV